MSKSVDYKLIYKHNNFSVDAYSFTIDTLKHTPLYTKTFAILTAYNPHNETLKIEENIKRNQLLQKQLNKNAYIFEEALGYLHDHQEESYCVYEIEFEKAIEIAAEHNQYSIFYHSKNFSGYYEVHTKSLIV